METWLARADQSIGSAEAVRAIGDYDRACSTAYYAMFYASRAALIHVGQAERGMGKTHSGMVSAFNRFLVLPGLVDRSFSKSFGYELNRRIIADYEEGGVTAQDAADAIENAREFVATVRALIAGAVTGVNPVTSKLGGAKPGVPAKYYFAGTSRPARRFATTAQRRCAARFG